MSSDMIMTIYNIILDLCFPPLALLFLLLSLFNARLRRTFFQRLGINRIKPGAQRPVWFHCSSLGEFNAVKGIIRGLTEHGREVVVTCLTDTGQESAQKFLGREHVCILPLDFSFLLGPFIRKIRPCLLVIEETEIWPNLIGQSGKASVPILYTNAIISRKSFRIYSFLSSLFKAVLRPVSLFFVQNRETGRYLRDLGVPPSRIKYEGNIKFDVTVKRSRTPGLAGKRLFPSGSTVLVAGSTRPGEERMLLEAYGRLKREFKGLKLVLAPRHLDRIGEIKDLVKKAGLQYSLFSGPRALYDVLLVDRMGILTDMYSTGHVCFVGGTLVPVGGHNPLEAAYFRKPVLFGPYIRNNRESFLKILMNKGGIMVKDGDGLYAALKGLLRNRPGMRAMGRNAYRVIRENRGASARIARYIMDHY